MSEAKKSDSTGQLGLVPKPRPVQCAWCGKLFTKGGDMGCGARVPSHIARGPDGAWCKTNDIVKMLEKP